jgi:hypothetical protein
VSADASGHWQHRERRRLWIGVIPNYLHGDEEVDACIARLARGKYVSLEHYYIEIDEHPTVLGGGRHIYAVRRPVDDVTTDLL